MMATPYPYPFPLRNNTWYLPALDLRVMEMGLAVSNQGNRNVERVFETPTRSLANPIIKYPPTPIYPHDGGFCNFVYNDDGSRRLYYQEGVSLGSGLGLGYAGSSSDGNSFTIPTLGTYAGMTTTSLTSNVLYMGVNDDGTTGPFVFRYQGRYYCTYRSTGGLRIVESADGLAWLSATDRVLHPVGADTQAILMDDGAGGFFIYTRPRWAFGLFGSEPLINDANQRMTVAATYVTTLNAGGPSTEQVQSVIALDEQDLARNWDQIYAFAPWRHESGVFLAFINFFTLGASDTTQAEFCWSYDGITWLRPATRVTVLPLGSAGQWDAGFVLAAPGLDRLGALDRMLYSGWDLSHDITARQAGQAIPTLGTRRNAGIGLAEFRINGLAARRFPIGTSFQTDGSGGGGMDITRPLLWPGGGLFMNVAPSSSGGTPGEFRVRVTHGEFDSDRRLGPGELFGPVTGFDWSNPITQDTLSQEVTWPSGANIRSLVNQIVRLEVYGRSQGGTPTAKWYAFGSFS